MMSVNFLFNATILGLQTLAQQYPKQLQLEERTNGT